MYKKKYIGKLCMSLLVLFFVTGCQGQEAQKEAQTPKGDEQQTTAPEEVNQQVPQEVKIEEEEQLSPAQYNRLYMDLLENKVEFYYDEEFAKNNLMEEYRNPEGHMLLGDYLHNFCAEQSEYMDYTVTPRNIGYAMLDLGKDGKPDLLVSLNDQSFGEYSSDATNYLFISRIDGKLQAVYATDFGYRSYGEVNEYGFYNCSGSNGAAAWGVNYTYIDGNGQVHELYDEQVCNDAYSLYVPDNTEYVAMAERKGITDKIEIHQYNFEPFDPDEDFNVYLQKAMWNYYALDKNYAQIEGNKNIYKENNDYRIFWDTTGLPLHTEEQIEQKIEDVFSEAGVTDEIRSGELVNILPLSEKQVDLLYAWKTENLKQYYLPGPPWEYTCNVNRSGRTTGVSLSQIAGEPNDIVDDYSWFWDRGWSKPDWNNFVNGDYHFKLTGGEEYYPHEIEICNKQGESLYKLDLTAYRIPDQYNNGDADFIAETIKWAAVEDDILYVCTSHNTYADSAPHNAYISAIDLKKDGALLWRTEPLTCNANNFVLYKDAIICGYGFTDEPDYIYVLDKKTGARCADYSVATSPDWFYVDGDILYVRCYDADYEFRLEEE